ncbi:hypothetical protein TNCV_1884761 [Trichonephila clavipes]|nr:hypothetical protein TNCV_1884761 [Trichonephila clavipes]
MRKIAHAGSTARTMVNISMEAANSPEQIYDELAALQSVFLHSTRSYTRAFGDGPRNFEPWSSDADDT